jgi:uncharacterized protein with PQ loop repeat
VVQIHKFFKEKQKEAMVNMPILILHTTTFVLYLVAALFNYITLTIYYFNSQNDEAFRAYLWAVFFY